MHPPKRLFFLHYGGSASGPTRHSVMFQTVECEGSLVFHLPMRFQTASTPKTLHAQSCRSPGHRCWPPREQEKVPASESREGFGPGQARVVQMGSPTNFCHVFLHHPTTVVCFNLGFLVHLAECEGTVHVKEHIGVNRSET